MIFHIRHTTEIYEQRKADNILRIVSAPSKSDEVSLVSDSFMPLFLLSLGIREMVGFSSFKWFSFQGGVQGLSIYCS